MPGKQRRERHSEKLFDEVRAQVDRRLAGTTLGLPAGQESLAYLSWLLAHCERFAELPSFLVAARGDIVSLLHAGALGMERTAYLHARSLLENVIRHCYFDSRPALFVARQLDPEDGIRDVWGHHRAEVERLPHFRPAIDSAEEKVSLFAAIDTAYQQACRFVHGSTLRYRSLHQSIQSVDMDEERTKILDLFLQQLGEACLLLLSLYHLGPYLLISQPIRRHMLRAAMSPTGRARFLDGMDAVPLTWARHQRSAALRALRERKRGPVISAGGLLLGKDSSVLVASPVRGSADHLPGAP